MSTSGRLRILQYSPGMIFALGGVVRAVLDWCTVLAARGNEVILVTYDSPDLPKDWDGSAGKPKVVWIPAPSRPNWFVTPEAVRIWETLLSPGSVAHLHCAWTASNIQMARSARARDVPYVVSMHGMLNEWSMQQHALKKRFYLNTVGRRYLCGADRIHYTANAERDSSQKWLPGSRAAVLPYLIDLNAFGNLPGPEPARARFAVAGDAPTLLCLSRLHPKKGVEILIDAADLLRRSGVAFKVVIAGAAAEADRDYETKLHEQVARRNLSGLVQFVGLVTGAKKISLYQAADLFVLPTRQENFGLVLIEAMACGTPVLTTRGTDIWQELAAGGATISDNTPEAMCEAIGKLLADRTALAEVGKRSREWVMDRFNSDKLAAEYERLYAQLISEHQG